MLLQFHRCAWSSVHILMEQFHIFHPPEFPTYPNRRFCQKGKHTSGLQLYNILVISLRFDHPFVPNRSITPPPSSARADARRLRRNRSRSASGPYVQHSVLVHLYTSSRCACVVQINRAKCKRILPLEIQTVNRRHDTRETATTYRVSVLL